jgi:hypothetical protein
VVVLEVPNKASIMLILMTMDGHDVSASFSLTPEALGNPNLLLHCTLRLQTAVKSRLALPPLAAWLGLLLRPRRCAPSSHRPVLVLPAA